MKIRRLSIMSLLVGLFGPLALASNLRSVMDPRVVYGPGLARTMKHRSKALSAKVEYGPTLLKALTRRYGKKIGYGNEADAFMLNLFNHPAANAYGEVVVKIRNFRNATHPMAKLSAAEAFTFELAAQRKLQSMGWRVAPLHEGRTFLSAAERIRVQPYIRGTRVDQLAGVGYEYALTKSEVHRFTDRIERALDVTEASFHRDVLDLIDRNPAMINADLPVNADLHWLNLIFSPRSDYIPGSRPRLKDLVVIDW